MASFQLTEVLVATQRPATDPPTMYVVQGTQALIAIKTTSLNAVKATYQLNGSILDVRTIFIDGSSVPIYVTETYGEVKALIDGL